MGRGRCSVRFAGAAVLGLAAAGPVRADSVHVYGPEGSGTERRALVVVEGADGRCVPWDGSQLELEALDSGTRLVLEEAAGPCARWVRIDADAPRETVEVGVRGDATATVGVAMGGDVGLDVQAVRRGRRARVTVRGASQDESVRVTVHWPGGSRELERTARGRFEGRVPPHAPLGVVARSATLVGAELVAPSAGHREPHVLLMRSDLAVPAGGAPRTVAFLLATDDRGRPSRHVPLRVASERGRLRGMHWLHDGLAAIELSARPGAASVDLAVSTPHTDEPVAVQFPVSTGWPAAAEVEAPAEAREGEPVEVGARVVDARGEPLDGATVRVRCGESVVELSGDAQRPPACAAAAEGSLPILAQVEVDGRWIPLGVATVAVRGASEPPEPVAEPAREPAPQPAPRAEPRASGPRVVAGVFAHAGIDTWRRAWGGAGARVGVRTGSWARVGAAVRYGASRFEARPQDTSPVRGTLRGTRHATDAMVIGGGTLDLDAVGLDADVGLGVAWVRDDASLEQTSADADGWRLIGQLAAGPSFGLGSVHLDARIGARLRLAELGGGVAGPWSESPARFFLEVGVGVAP